ncbi:sulfotransferase domain-containing protein [Aerosakkonema funiforme]|uniref:sulfotransferase domain-containing protein n=1 Tax=Aerosakkonema funiforme TaxID=1246630 RepID=UPI0035BA68AB
MKRQDAIFYPNTRNTLPTRIREYHSHHLDSTFWDNFEPRDDDIFVCTYFKSGTTWMQQIVAMLIFQGENLPIPLSEMSIWVDNSLPKKEKILLLQEQNHRRIIKSHLPIDAILFYPQCKYIYVGRDGRDIFISLFNHYKNASDLYFEAANNTLRLIGDPLPECPDDPLEFWKNWISKGWFEWEKDGYPFWSLFYNVQSWWNYRHLPNILFVHFANLKKDLAGEIRRIATFLDIEIDPNKFNSIIEKCTFEYMKKNPDSILAPFKGAAWKGGASTFINKGTNGRWKDVLTAKDIEQYQTVVAERLTPECAYWLETGELP